MHSNLHVPYGSKILQNIRQLACINQKWHRCRLLINNSKKQYECLAYERRESFYFCKECPNPSYHVASIY